MISKVNSYVINIQKTLNMSNFLNKNKIPIIEYILFNSHRSNNLKQNHLKPNHKKSAIHNQKNKQHSKETKPKNISCDAFLFLPKPSCFPPKHDTHVHHC